MTLPTVEKTWQFKTNAIKPLVSGGANYDMRLLMLHIKKLLTTFPLFPWTVTGSSNTTTGAMDAVDRWPTYLTGTDTNATVNTSGGNNVLRVRAAGVNSAFVPFTVTSGAATAKTTIRDDLNNGGTGFPSVPATANLVASVDGSNRLVISDSSDNVSIEIDSIANGSTLGTPCGFTSGGMNTANNLTWNSAGSAHSWIVLKQAGIHANFEICLDCSNISIYIASIVMGVSGFTGGSNLNRPTATTQQILLNNTGWFNNNNSTPFVTITHVLESNDGECTRVVTVDGSTGFPVLFWLFDKPKNPTTGWVNPAIGFAQAGQANTTTAMDLPRYNDTARVYGYLGTTWAAMFMTCEGITTQTLPEFTQFQQRNQLTLEEQFWPIGLVSETTLAKGRHGQIYDMWWGTMSAVNLGGFSDTTYPDDSSRKFWQSDDIIQPWPGINTPPGPLPIVRY